MKASIQALENIAKEMKKKGIQKISMMGKSDPKTMDKMEAMSDATDMLADKGEEDSVVPPSEVVGGKNKEEPKSEEETAAHEAMPGDPAEDMAEGEPHSEDDPELKDKLDLIKKLLGRV